MASVPVAGRAFHVGQNELANYGLAIVHTIILKTYTFHRTANIRTLRLLADTRQSGPAIAAGRGIPRNHA